jgi:hypothetical protein
LVCEHDIFTVIEEFKQQSSFQFYKDLMDKKEVPRNYQSITDKSDQMFFDIFTNDMKKITNILRIHRRMMGIDISDDPTENEQEQMKFTKKSDYEKAVLQEIEYILVKISERVHSSHHSAAVDMIIKATSLAGLRSDLCKLTAKHMNFDLKPRNDQEVVI